MKHNVISFAKGFGLSLVLGLPMGLQAQPFTLTSTGITNFRQVVLPTGMDLVVKAVNVGGTEDKTINGITFAADTNLPSDVASFFNGNGYTAQASTESSGADASTGIGFAGTTINTGDENSGGYIHGNAFEGLSTNTDYVFEIFLSDNHSRRGFQFTYILGSTSETANIVQDFGDLNQYQVSFNTGTDTTFSWALDPVVDYHDGKLSGYALFSASPIPEPSTYAAIFGVVVLGFGAYRRRQARA